MSDSIKLEKPDVYTISLAKAHGLKDGDTVRLITERNQELTVVARVVNDKTFSAETKEPLGDKVFVYGKECTDLRSIDYDAISMLNVSATQELAKEVKTLQEENSDLHAKITALEASHEKLTAMASKLEALEKAVTNIQAKDNEAIRTVALGK